VTHGEHGKRLQREVLMLRSIFSFLDSALFIHRVYKTRPVDFHGLGSMKWGPEDEGWKTHPGRWQTCEECQGKGGLRFENRSSLFLKIVFVFLVIFFASIGGGIVSIRKGPPP